MFVGLSVHEPGKQESHPIPIWAVFQSKCGGRSGAVSV